MPIFVEHWGGITCNFTPILPYFQLRGMNLDHDFFQVSKLSEDQKIRSSPKERKLCSPNCSGDLRSNAHQSQIIGGMQVQTILNLSGEIQSNWGDRPISTHPPPWVLAPLSVRR